MNNDFDIQQLIQAAEIALNSKEKGLEFMLDDVYRQTRVAYERYPEDPVIRQVAFTIERMADNAKPGTTISQKDVSNIFNNFVRLSDNTKFRAVLGHLLVHSRQEYSKSNDDYVKMNRVDAEPSSLSTDGLIDKNLTHALESAFDGSLSFVKAYDEKKAEIGKDYVRLELQALGIQTPKVDVLGGNQKTLVYVAHLDGRHGVVSVAIPIQLSDNGQVLFPSTFVANDQLQSLTSQNLHYFIDKKSETKDFSVPKTNDILKAVGILTGEKTLPNNDFESLAGVFGNKPGTISMAVPNLFVDRKYEEPRQDIDISVKAEMPKELAHLAKDFEDSILESASAFGKKAISVGKEMVLTELRSAGFKNAQVRFGSESGDSIVYLATLPTPKGPIDVEVPVDMVSVANSGFVPLFPKYFAYDGIIEDFIPSKLQRFAISIPNPSTGSRIYKDAFAYMTLPELKDQIITAISGNDYITCEAILGQIGERFSEEDYRNSVSDYNFMLTQKSTLDNNVNAVKHTCSKIIQAGKGSIYARCGHFGIPLSQVVIDAQGFCRMKSAEERAKLNPIQDSGAAISTSKLHLT